MTKQLLLPYRFKFFGWCLAIPSAISGLILSYKGYEAFAIKAKVFSIYNQELMGDDHLFTFIDTNITATVVGALFILGGVFVGFSKEKQEDEFISKLRLSSLIWAVWVNYILLFLAFLFFYQMTFLHVMVYNMFTILIIFIVRFHYMLYRSTKILPGEK
jgi:hypothetical protein